MSKPYHCGKCDYRAGSYRELYDHKAVAHPVSIMPKLGGIA